MTIKIAVIGSADFIRTILSVAPQVGEIDIEPYVYDRPEEAAELVKHLKPCDILFFSGALPYYFSKEVHESMPIPSLYLEQDETAIAISLLSLISHQHISLERISIDLTESSFIQNILADIGFRDVPLYIMDYADKLPNKFDINDIVDFHYSLFQAGKSDRALTSIHAVYDKLQQLGVPAQRMIDPVKSLIHGLQNAKAQAELTKSHSATIAAGYISLKQTEATQKEHLAAFARKMNATIQPSSETAFLLYSTRGDIEIVMNSEAFHEFLLNWQEPVAVGFGYGFTAAEANQNAKIARSFAAHHEPESCGYILTEDKELLGPFPKEKKTQRLKNDHPEWLQIAKETKLSPANISKIIQFSKSRQSLQFTAADLSDYLQVTRRSTERILKKLVDHGFVKIVGEEMTYQQGRPRSIYELNMPIY
ncbi:transcriptional regulator [Bacillus sp. FJAT-27231]|uniref:transcriptional regulator n=1 Tax=Bacillus sp. FJAT-27231 TaxID=1679168 RepID=UPI000670B197|nr:transcriptional regulator [Bacillus sp. FJAT-27231]KMY53359.1 transcriptional regulator [Bacillus sp. FJAT-27231]